MLPQHGAGAQNSPPPYHVSYQNDNIGDPIKVCLCSTGDKIFMGFILKALEKDKDGGPPLGTFSLIDSDVNRLLTCNGLPNSAVSQRSNKFKTQICVNWTLDADKAVAEIIFRATFLHNYNTFWTNVDVDFSQHTTSRPSTHPATLSTQPSTTTSPHPGTTTSPHPAESTTTPEANNTFYVLEKAGTVEINFVTFLGVLKMELSNIFLTALFNGPFSRGLNKMSQIFFVVLCGAVEISSLVLFCLVDPIKVTLVALVSVAIGINFVELVIVCLPIGPSHELKEICDHAVNVSSFIHQIFTTAVIFVGILELDKYKNHWTDSRILKVMVAFAVLLLLFEMWVFVSSTQRKAILRRRRTVTGWLTNSERARRRGKKEKLGAAEGIFIAVSVIFLVGSLCFAVAVAVMLLGCHQDRGCA
ncbi:uncharacterized protein ACO6RY_18518 [Pungitius sinensis]